MESCRAIKGHGEHKWGEERVIGIIKRRAVRRDQWREIKCIAEKLRELEIGKEQSRAVDNNGKIQIAEESSGEFRKDVESNGGPRRPEKRSREKSKK